MNILVKNLSSGISIVQINDPKTYNSLSFKTLNDLIKVLKKIDQDKKTKVIIIEGAGKGFSAGHNLKEVKSLKVRNKYQKLFNLCSKLMLQIVEGNKPVIAKVHGAAYAAGCQLVASCDLAYSTKDALFATPGVNIGLFCSTPMVAANTVFKTAVAMSGVTAILTWFVWAILIFVIGVKLFPDKNSKVPFKKVLTAVGFAHAPGLLRFFAVTPELMIPIIFLTQFWIFAGLMGILLKQ